MANQGLRKEAKQAGVKIWQIADKMGICDMTLSRRLRYEFSETQKTEMRRIIAELTKEKSLRESEEDYDTNENP